MDPQSQNNPTIIPQTTLPTTSKRVYPLITAERNTNPKRFYAIPLLGWLIKLIMSFPVFFIFWFASLCYGIGQFINPFVVLFTGKYWNPAYTWTVRYVNLLVKINFYFLGITDKYPGFNFTINDNYKVEIPFPTVPNRWYAFPLLGFVLRFILLFPFILFGEILLYSCWLLTTASSFHVLFKKYYPESAHELAVDSMRVYSALILYFAGISDTYPSFKISKKHLILKIVFIVLGGLLFLSTFANNPQTPSSY